MTQDQILTAKVPKHFWIPSKSMFITAGAYVKLYKICKANPGLPVKETISGWWPGTTDEVLKQIWQGIEERINLRQFIETKK